MLKMGFSIGWVEFINEGLSSHMRLVERDSLLKRAKIYRQGPQISHLLFVDDCILFGETIREEARLNVHQQLRMNILEYLGVLSSSDQKKYLGLPNMVGQNKKRNFQLLKDHVSSRINNWCIKPLSQGG
ncbi:reverse transcriptase [Gossypium australe]|uniref:Reverse transcriptase n=1 Tax=Gossypium australe TaxID=47621 RepID=A0A5B6VKC8_9ROSI|nr:reverse transcriptase [Gossypium australe]